MKEKDFDHPCRDTCSGWKQGYERGHADLGSVLRALSAYAFNEHHECCPGNPVEGALNCPCGYLCVEEILNTLGNGDPVGEDRGR